MTLQLVSTHQREQILCFVYGCNLFPTEIFQQIKFGRIHGRFRWKHAEKFQILFPVRQRRTCAGVGQLEPRKYQLLKNRKCSVSLKFLDVYLF